MLQRCARRPSSRSKRLRWRPNAATCGVALAVGFFAPCAQAAEPVRLQWVRLDGADACIDSATLEARVQRRLGSDPFDPRASRSIEGLARRSGHVWRAQIVVRAHPNDPNPPLRALESTAADCDSLSDAVVLAVALAIDPAAAFNEAKVKAAPPPAETPKEPSPPSAPTPTPTLENLAGRADLSLAAQAGLLPRPALGVALGAGVRLTRRFEFGLQAQTFPEVEVDGDPSYAVGLSALTLELCGVAQPAKIVDLRACAGPSLGLLHASVLEGERTQPGERTSFAANLGVDAAFALTPVLAIRLGARAVVSATRYRFTVEGTREPLFVQSAIAGIAHVGLELHFGTQGPNTQD